jgi:hypothetical protein
MAELARLRVPPAASGQRRRGAAFVEAVLVILFMTIVLAGILYFGRYFEARQGALALARQCAWAYSRNSCQEDPRCGEPGHFPCLPPRCAELLRLEQEPDPELRNAVADVRALVQASGRGHGSAATVSAQERFREGVAEKTAEMLEMLVGEYAYAASATTIEGSPALPGAATEVNVRYFLPCNSRQKDSLDIAVELFSKLRPPQP